MKPNNLIQQIRSHFEYVFIVTILATSPGCFAEARDDATTLNVCNTNLMWNFKYVGSEVKISGKEGREILEMTDPPLSILLEALDDKDKWQAAHVLLTFRYQKSHSSTVNHWNGMKIDLGSDAEVEMKKIKEYEIDVTAEGKVLEVEEEGEDKD